MELTAHGVGVRLPPGWDVRARRQQPTHPNRPGNLLVHAATMPLPPSRGDFGSGVVDLLGPDDVFVSLFEHDPDSAGKALFAAQGMPVPRVDDFSTAALQRPWGDHTGAQWFFSISGRAFCLHVVLSSHARRAAGVRRVRPLLQGISVGRTS